MKGSSPAWINISGQRIRGIESTARTLSKSAPDSHSASRSAGRCTQAPGMPSTRLRENRRAIVRARAFEHDRRQVVAHRRGCGGDDAAEADAEQDDLSRVGRSRGAGSGSAPGPGRAARSNPR